jgi:hypothetical protein
MIHPPNCSDRSQGRSRASTPLSRDLALVGRWAGEAEARWGVSGSLPVGGEAEAWLGGSGRFVAAEAEACLAGGGSGSLLAAEAEIGGVC